MTQSDAKPEGEKRRGRPAHWAHPVDEAGRAARARRWRRRRIVALVIVLIAVSLVGAYRYLTSDKRVEKFAEAYLEDLLGTRVVIGHAQFSWGQGLELDGLYVASPAPFPEPILVAERVDLKIDPMSILRLSPQVTEIRVAKPRIDLVLWDEKVWNFQALAKNRPPGSVVPSVRPIVAIEGGEVRLERKIGGVTVYENKMDISGTLVPSETDPDTLRFQTDVTSRQLHLAVASGLLNVQTGELRFEGQASNVDLSPELYRSMPAEVQRLWSRFEPTGSVNLKVLFDEKKGFSLGAEMTGVSFSYEYNGMLHKFENLTGRLAFSPALLELTGVQGLMNGAPIRLDGKVTSFDGPQLALDLSISAAHVDIEAHRSLLTGLDPNLEEIYTNYALKGPVDVTMTARRAPEKGAILLVWGAAFCRDMQMMPRLFPYRMDQVRGTVRFGPEGIAIENVTGVHGEAELRLDGWAKNPGPLAESHVTVHATGVPLDEDLRAALGPKERKTYDEFSPSGRANVVAEVHRPPVRGALPVAVVTMNLDDCKFKYRYFPYAMDHATGKIVIAPGRADITDVRGRHGQAVITLSGTIIGQPQGEPAIDLVADGQGVALDDDLLAVLPEREQGILRTFHLGGVADIKGTVRRSAAETGDELRYDMAIRLRGARMIYEPFPFLAEEVTGDLHLTNGAVRIESLTGFNSGARIEASGWIEQKADDYAMDMTLTGKDVPLGETLRGALGPGMRTVWSRLSPRGRVDLKARLTKQAGAGKPMEHHVWVTMLGAGATLDIFPYPLEHMIGQMEFLGSEVLLHDIHARSGLTEFALAGRIAYANDLPTVDLVLRTKGLRLEGPLRDAIPEPLKRAFALIKPTGRIDLDIDRLSYREEASGAKEAAFHGTAVLDEVGVEPGLRISGIVGTAEMHGHWTDAGVELGGRMQIQQGKVADMDISDTRIEIEKPLDAQSVSLRRIEGQFYGGSIDGSASVGLAASPRYDLDIAATGIDFERLLRDGFLIEHNITGGRMRATLGLRARGPDAAAIEASGYADVADARLFQLPMIVRVLSAFGAAKQDASAFEKARILYFVRGKKIYLGDIRLDGSAISLYGTGIVEPGGRLNLTFLVGKRDTDPLIPALSELAEGIRKQLAVVVVSGTLAEPQVEVRTLSAVTEPIRELLKMVAEQRARDAKAAPRRP